MCVSVPGRVTKVFEKEAIVSFQGVEKKINTIFVEDLQVGEYVLVHVGCAIEKIDEEEALKTIELFESLIGGKDNE